jgi:hypothetical protein
MIDVWYKKFELTGFFLSIIFSILFSKEPRRPAHFVKRDISHQGYHVSICMRQEKKNKLMAIFVVLIMVFVAFVVAAAALIG